MQNAERVGSALKEHLCGIAENSKIIGDVRGLGLMIGVELVKDKVTKARAKKATEKVMVGCFERGLMLLPCGPNGIRFSPPLTITEKEADTAVEIFAAALHEVESSM